MPSPFQILGLLPSLVNELSEDQLAEVAKSAARALQRIHHPDRGGNADRSATINWAMEQLADRNAFRKEALNYAKDGLRKSGITSKELELEGMRLRLAALDAHIGKMRGSAPAGAATVIDVKCAEAWSAELLSPSPSGSDEKSAGIRGIVGKSFRYSLPDDIKRLPALVEKLKWLEKEELGRAEEVEARYRCDTEISALRKTLYALGIEIMSLDDETAARTRAHKKKTRDALQPIDDRLEQRKRNRAGIVGKIERRNAGPVRFSDLREKGMKKTQDLRDEILALERRLGATREEKESETKTKLMAGLLHKISVKKMAAKRMAESFAGRETRLLEKISRMRAEIPGLEMELGPAEKRIQAVEAESNLVIRAARDLYGRDIVPIRRSLEAKMEEMKAAEASLKEALSLKARLVGNLSGRGPRIACLKTEIDTLEAGRSGFVGSDGTVVLEGINTGLRLAGHMTGHFTYFMEPAGRGSLRPSLVIGEPIICIGPVGGNKNRTMMRNVGVLIKAGWDIVGDEKKDTERETREAERETPSIGTDMVIRSELAPRINPLEVIGVSPQIVRELGQENTKSYVKGITDALRRVLHPEYIGIKKNVGLYTAVMAAKAGIDDAESLKAAVSEYSYSEPLHGRLSRLEWELESIKGLIRGRTPDLADVMARRSRLKQNKESESLKARNFLNFVFDGIYGERKMVPDGSGFYLFQSGGLDITVIENGAQRVYSLKERGFEVFAVSGNLEKRVLGCMKSGACVPGNESPIRLYHIIKPLIFEGGVLGIAENGHVSALGVVARVMRADPALGAKEMGAMHEDAGRFKRILHERNDRGKGALAPSDSGTKAPESVGRAKKQ
jgi:hypothetical protein